MRIEDHKLLLEYARLQLGIAKAKDPMASMDVPAHLISRTVGFKKLRAWVMGYPKKYRDRPLKWIRSQLDAYAAIIAKAKAAGETGINLAEIDLSVFDEKTREPAPSIDVFNVDEAKEAANDDQ